MERHHAKIHSTGLVGNVTERKESANKWPVRIDAASPWSKKDAASIGLKLENGMVLFNVNAEKFPPSQPEASS